MTSKHMLKQKNRLGGRWFFRIIRQMSVQKSLKDGKAWGWLWLVVCLGWVFVSRCAQPVPPQGGTKDTIPPQLLNSEPRMGTRLYDAQKVRLVFNERIAVRQLQQKLLLTPQRKELPRYQVKVKRNAVELDFETPFEPETTYTLLFLGGITDITERNEIRPLSIAFSTGTQIDSLSITGELYWATTTLVYEEEAALIFLVALDTADSLHYTARRADYLTRPNKRGRFRFGHLGAGRYRLWAIVDANQNRRAELESEAHAFAVDTIELGRGTTGSEQSYWRLPLVVVDARAFVFVGGRPQGRHYVLNYNKALQDFDLRILAQEAVEATGSPGGGLPLYAQLGTKGRSIIVYRNGYFSSPKDSLLLEARAYDAQGNQRLDSVYVRFTSQSFEEVDKGTPRQGERRFLGLGKRKAAVVSPGFSWEVEWPLGRVDHGAGVAMGFRFKQPLIEQPPQGIYFLFSDSSRQEARFFERKLGKQKLLQQGRIRVPWEEVRAAQLQARADTLKREEDMPPLQVELVFDKGAFISFLGDSSEQKTVSMEQADPRAYGEISGVVRGQARPLLLDLIQDKQTKDGALVLARERLFLPTAADSLFRFSPMPAGNYRLRLILDVDNNGRWTPSNLLNNQPPEPIHMSETSLSVRKNWRITDLRLQIPQDFKQP